MDSSRRDRRAEFEATCLPFKGSLYGAALRLTRQREDAGDLVQETFLRAYRSFESFTPGSNAKAWLFRILHSVFVNRYHKRRREPRQVSVEEVEERFLAAQADQEALLAEGTIGDEEILRAMDDLPEAFRAAVILVDMHGLSYEEAAGALSCPLGTLRSRLSRARKLLFVHLHDYARKAGLVRTTS